MRQPPIAPPKKKRPPQGRPPQPSEISTGLGPPPQRKRAPQPLAPSPEDVHPRFNQPNAPPPDGPPVRVLQKFGTHLSISGVNDRVQEITDAYHTTFGHLPSPGLVFDLLRSPVGDFHGLFRATPRSSAVAQAKGALATHGSEISTGLAKPPKPFPQMVIDDAAQALREGNLHDFEKQNHTELQALIKDPKWGPRLYSAIGSSDVIPESAFVDAEAKRTQAKLLKQSQRLDYERELARQRGEDVTPYDEKIVATHEKLARAGVFGAYQPGRPATLFETGVTQIATSLRYAPAGLYMTGKAGYLDVGAAVHGDVSFKRTRKIGEQAVKGLYRDVRHPSENPGYLFMDVLGLASAGAGAGVRVTRAAGALGHGEVRVAARSLLTRPTAGTYVLRKGGAEEHVLLFENPVAQVFQRGALKLRQRALDRRDVNPAARQPLTAGRRIDFSSEKKLAREAAARTRVEDAIAKTYKVELEKAAGWSIVSAEVFRRLPVVVRRTTEQLPGHAPFGLTRGEQKAIQVLSTDDPNPLQLHRDFHERMMQTPDLGKPFGIAPEDFIRNHQRHLADLKVAGKVLADLEAGKARKRFVNAVDLTRRVIAEQERLKIEELGLLPDIAERRIIAPSEVLRAGEVLPDTAKIHGEIRKLEGLLAAKHVEERAPHVAKYGEGSVQAKIDRLQKDLAATQSRITAYDRATHESFYLPFIPKRYKKAVPRGITRRAKAGPYGIPMPKSLPELSHVFTGKSIVAGDFRVDATALAGESYGRTVRLVSVRNDHARLLKMAKETQAEAGPFAVPIRDLDGVPPKLKERLARIDEGEFTAKDAATLEPSEIDSILHELYPNPAEKLDNVKWVDGRLVGDEGVRVKDGRVVSESAQPGAVSSAFDIANEPFRFSYLFLRPAYALNLIGNTGMALMHQGVYLPPNLVRAVFAEKVYGGDIARALDALTGEGKMQAIAETAGTGKLTATSRFVAHSWSILTDRHFRRSAVIHELRRMGYRTPEQMRSALFDKEHLTSLTQARRRANKAMVEFDNLTWYEKNVLRHVIFVYPWVSRSAVWSLRTLIEHPVQSAILVELGRQAKEDEDPLFAHAPNWVKRTGYIPVGLTPDGNPKVINPTSVNTFSTIGDLMDLATGGQVPEDFASPMIEVGVRAITQADQYGQRFKGKERFYGPFAESVKQIPLYGAFAGPKKQPVAKPLDVSSREALVKHEHEALKQSVLTPDWMGNWGRVIGGGMSPSVIHLDAAAARYWRDQPLEARNKHERELIQQGLTLQGKLLNEKVPLKVRQAVEIMGEQTLRRSQRSTKLGRDVPAVSKEGALVDIQVLQEKGKLSTPEAQELRKRLNKVPDPQALQRFVGDLHKFGGSADLGQWQADVNLIASFTPASVNAHVAELKRQGLVSSAPKADNQEALYQLGRQVLAFQRELARRTEAHKHDQRGAKSIFLAELRAYQDGQDKPVRAGDHTFPSVVRMAWALLTPKEQADHRVSITDADWKSLTAFDKELLGRPSSAAVSRGWANFARVVAAFRGDVPMEGIPALPPGTNLAPNQINWLARYVDRGEKGYLDPASGFYKDWLFSRDPKYRRLQMLKPIQKSPYQSQWHYLFSNAGVLGKELGQGRYTNSALKEAWHGWVNGSEYQAWLAKQPAGFQHEIDAYGPDFVTSLLN